MENFIVEFFEKNDGTSPAKDFVLSQNIKMRVKLFRTLELLEIKGNELREPYSKFLGDGIFEVRVKQGTNISRVLYFFISGKKIILTNGYVKKSQKTLPSEINLAKKYREEYFERRGNNGRKF